MIHPTDDDRQAQPVLRYLSVLALAGSVLLADQISKAIVTSTLSGGQSVSILGGLVRLDYTVNTGAAFSILRAQNLLFVVVAVIVSAGIIISFRRLVRAGWLVRLALGLILGGALGNLVDRVRLGYVRDFIDLRWWPVFNLADSAIVIGVIMLATATMLSRDRG